MDSTGRVKLADVARAADVSIATVSKVVNGRYGVAPETAAHVQRVIDELGYVGNISAAALRGRRTHVLGVLLGGFDPFTSELLKGAEAAAADSGYEILAHSGGRTAGWERRSLARLGGTLIDGAILVTPTADITAPPVPAVAIDPNVGLGTIPTVDSDNDAGARALTAHLTGLGHRRIGFIGGRGDLESGRRREDGFRAAMTAAGVTVDESLVVEAGYDPDRAARAVARMLASRDRPTAIFAANDMMALAVLEVAARMRLRVPEDLSVAGFDDVPEAAGAPVPLTTVRQPMEEMGSEAMRMLLALLRDGTCAAHARMTTELVVRASTAPPPS